MASKAKNKNIGGVKMPLRATSDAIVRRFLKLNQAIYWAREMAVWSRLWKRYPSLPFWQTYELPFGNHSLNMLSWFERNEGPADLERAWVLWHYVPPTLDTSPQVEQNSGDEQPSVSSPAAPPDVPAPPVLAPQRARTVADLMRGA